MATKHITLLIDDVSGEALDEGAGETVHFALDGKSYEIDLSDENAASLRDTLANWISAARRVGGAGAPRTTTKRNRAPRTASEVESGNIRDWAQANGYSVPNRGRIPAGVAQAYRDAHADAGDDAGAGEAA